MNDRDALWIVPSHAYVDRMVRGGRIAETRTRLRARLFDALVTDRALATAIEARLVLGDALAAIAPSDALLAPIARAGGEPWERTIDAVDVAIGALRAAGTRVEALLRVAGTRGAAGARAKMLGDAMRTVDEALAARKLVDPRSAGAAIVARIAGESPKRVRDVVGAASVAARFVVDWDGADAAWWRALDAALARAGGEGARVELPSFELSIDPSREQGPLDVVTEDVARALDAAPATFAIDAPLGDLRLVGAPPAGARAALCAARDAEGQARAVLRAVRDALDAGAAIEEIAIAAARFDELAIAALRRAFDEAGIPLHDARGEPPARAGIAAFAFEALAIGDRGLPRLDVAALARSHYVDPAGFGAERAALDDLARALERTATIAAGDPRASLVATARASDAGSRGADRAVLAARVADVLLGPAKASTRAEHVAAARALLAALGMDPLRASPLAAGALRRDDAAAGLARAELHAVARDAHAWELLHAAIADHEAACARVGVASRAIAPAAFRHELARALDARAGRPAAARAGAVRVAPLVELAGEELALLVVIDAAEGSLPATAASDPLVHEALAAALRAIDASRAPVHAAVRAAREMATLGLAASRARSILLARRTRDEDGAAIAPAPLVAWLERGGVACASPPRETTPIGARDEASIARRARIEHARESRFERREPPRDPILGDLDAAASPILARALADETGTGEAPLAITSLERFATCAFQGFADRVLRARRERPLRELPDAREHGTLKHRALAAAFSATAARWKARPRDAAAIREEALAAAERVVQSEAIASPLRRLALAAVRETVAAVVEWSLGDEAWDFAFAERAFGDGRASSWPALVIDDGASRLALRGSIDRVDVGHGRAAVRAVDYKSSKRGAESGMRELGETAFQVALYARVAAGALQAEDSAAAYVPATRRPDDVGPRLRQAFDARWIDLHEPRGDVTAIEAKALEVIGAIRGGALSPRPHEESACARCDVSGGCRKPRFAIREEEEERAERDPSLRSSW